MWPNPKFSADLVIFTEEILNRKFHLLCSVYTGTPTEAPNTGIYRFLCFTTFKS